MADNNQNSQDSTQQIIDFLKSYKWNYRFLCILNYCNLIPDFRVLENNFNYCFMFNRNWRWVYERPYTRFHELLKSMELTFII